MEQHKHIDRDIGKLDQHFRERIVELLARMKQHGHDPLVWEGMRSFERAQELQRKGSGVAMSMHCYGLAVDIISQRHMWDAPPEFWRDLRDTAEQLGLTSGKRFINPRRSLGDQPHVQALPAADDRWVRTATATEIAARVADHLSSTDPDRRTTVGESIRAKGRP